MPVETGIDIIKNLREYISICGHAVPTYVIDVPSGGGEIPINPEYVISIDDEKMVLKNYVGKVYTYSNVAS